MSARRWIITGIVSAGIVALVVWSIPSRQQVLKLVVCDVGQGDAILLQTPNGNDILVDGGRPDARVLACLGRHMLPWNRTIELVVLTHPDADHVGGLPAVASRYSISQVVDSGFPASTAVYRAWRKAMAEQRARESVVLAGDSLDFGGGVSAHVVGPLVTSTTMDPNEASVVLRVAYKNSTLLLTGDSGFESEQRMIEAHEDLSAQILKVGHHGSRYSSGLDFLAMVHPQIALISVAAKNSYGHPASETLDRLAAIGAKIFRTDQLGDLVWISNGTSWIQP